MVIRGLFPVNPTGIFPVHADRTSLTCNKNRQLFKWLQRKRRKEKRQNFRIYFVSSVVRLTRTKNPEGKLRKIYPLLFLNFFRLQVLIEQSRQFSLDRAKKI